MAKAGILIRERANIEQYRGVYISMDELVSLRGADVELDLRGRKKAMAAMAGMHRSSFRGRGIDFDEVRIYQAGDDVRNIDWRVTARTGRTHTKLFREERERPVYLVVDQRQPMFFGSQNAFKSVVAARVAAYFAWASRSHGDRIGGFLFSDKEVQELRPKEGKRGIQNFFRTLVQFNQALEARNLNRRSTRQSFINALQGLNHVVRPGSLVVIISDFLNYDDITQQHMSLLCGHNDVIAVQIFDPMEKHLPPSGVYGFTDGQRNVRLNTAPHQLRKDYALRFVERQSALKDQLNRIAVPLIEISTADSVAERLRATLGLRTAKGVKA
ncbi:DUF58 domain-containing protein [Ketobacter sp.]|uniref:DUF58 domain-containing protein n=1 Tax=Ketobacter sp. TaxID=2083498 RepID=UPI000F255F5D|nr:DUF58 domain-containing protein [Ketobacter sp.]RLT93509.1 MAG: DUF58 domain-containing protein [Ketobacter sp.]